LDLQHFRAVVIPNVTSLSKVSVDRLTGFVLDGGGLWLALGPRTDIREFNRLLFHDGDGLAPLAIDRVLETSSPDDPNSVAINPFPKSHPATAGLAGDEQSDIGDIKVTGRFRFRMPAAAHDVAVLLDLTSGDPLAVENRLGRGRVIVQAIPLRWQWSDLAASQSFVVMVHDWLSYLTEPSATRFNLQPGESISIHIPNANAKIADATLTMPNGEDVTITGEPVVDGILLRTSRTVLPGHYALDVGLSGDRIPFNVARAATESDLAGLTAANRTFLAQTAGLEQGTLTGRIAGSNQRNPLWPVLLMLLIVAIASELVLAGAIARQRFGMAPIPDSIQHEGSLSLTKHAMYEMRESPINVQRDDTVSVP
jgi:hypothetical protein